ncbi:(d)CMP kinase [Desulfonatronovibrio magnus]|uniref:(d)CMP kinase n=1 Tax=Desulfonatronovibrio magnus TaxID=698827 RepID=UPI0005EBAE3E|nr:(d)CMP kinase [Desulfonatronovibrio magnus]RQD63908.1 MAG: (d)CMP kinase [Desulfonatronovibrio sp. MSAO_Bac4]
MSIRPFIVTIDGPAGVGKSTLAAKIAHSLKIAYLDTGAMFRAVGWMMSLENENPDQKQIEHLILNMTFGLSGTGWNSQVILNGRELGAEIRTEEAGMMASKVGQIKEVRTFLKQAQQNIGRKVSLVAEGRDMGSVVFPDAQYKFFLDASAEIRADRRKKQLERSGTKADYDSILTLIRQRDEQDRNRPIAPLKPARDAIIINTGPHDLEGVYQAIKGYIQPG